MQDLYQLALEIAAKTITTINTEMVDCPRDLSSQFWTCDQGKEWCSVKQRIACWKKFFLEQADKVLKQSEDVVLEERLFLLTTLSGTW